MRIMPNKYFIVYQLFGVRECIVYYYYSKQFCCCSIGRRLFHGDNSDFIVFALPLYVFVSRFCFSKGKGSKCLIVVYVRISVYLITYQECNDDIATTYSHKQYMQTSYIHKHYTTQDDRPRESV